MRPSVDLPQGNFRAQRDDFNEGKLLRIAAESLVATASSSSADSGFLVRDEDFWVSTPATVLLPCFCLVSALLLWRPRRRTRVRLFPRGCFFSEWELPLLGSLGSLVPRGVYTALLYCCRARLEFVRGLCLCSENKAHTRSQQHTQGCRTVRPGTINIWFSGRNMICCSNVVIEHRGIHRVLCCSCLAYKIDVGVRRCNSCNSCSMSCDLLNSAARCPCPPSSPLQTCPNLLNVNRA